ncbi:MULTISPECIES: PHB depolymerase family esterase [unclassified Pseudomonas]|uniref:alpha/beta hydrolase family esterase n=1 Tax=unclassified Pseudomonas TaxID=196821 RepID=UPI00244AEB6D|nr:MULTISPECIES: PHB depolymerase family esterase [unclassified Pseudomonas]MDG9925513.1 alpha/beta hydrolase-fold protein [Pseudomonas sp. GD04045]MDH0034046.1 alpha/beta hydrolase-fold protein [Pseudomonas sp. GD04019]
MLTLLLLSAATLGALYGYFLHAPRPAEPVLGASLQHAQIDVGGRSRDFAYYLPAKLPAKAPLLFVLHGSLQSIDDMRTYSAYAFERLADEHGFIVVYPQGFKNNWNDCRRAADYPARTRNIDDLGLLAALVQRFAAEHGADPQRAFLVGYSNGGQLGLRAALERPQLLAGVAAVAANLPTDANLDCAPSGQAVPVLLMNGTRDPINPYNGGPVSLFGFGDRGTVRSAYESALYFANLAGYPRDAVRSSTAWSNPADPAQRVSLDQWQAEGRAEVALYGVIGGGHLLPQAGFRAPRLLGPTLSGFDGPRAIWDFFARQQSVPAQP